LHRLVESRYIAVTFITIVLIMLWGIIVKNAPPFYILTVACGYITTSAMLVLSSNMRYRINYDYYFENMPRGSITAIRHYANINAILYREQLSILKLNRLTYVLILVLMVISYFKINSMIIDVIVGFIVLFHVIELVSINEFYTKHRHRMHISV
jgi:hypothetical protein